MDQPDAPEHVHGLADPAGQPPPADFTPPRSDSTDLEPVPDQASALHPFGAALAPVLLEVCGGQLENVRWFRTDWQRGGALTGYCAWTDDDGHTHDAVVKMPVPPAERRWLVRLSSDDITPRVFAHGTSLGGYDLAWVVMERLPHGPVGSRWADAAVPLLADAAAHFYASARVAPREGTPKRRDWHALYKQSREHVSPSTVEQSQRWKKALREVGRNLDDWMERWRAREHDTWCHGDLHLGNAMTRVAPPDGPAVLFDLANIHVGHWVEDAVYFEHLYWASPDRLAGHKPVKMIARRLKDYGLSAGDDWPQLADLKRSLLAMSAPARMKTEGGAVQVAASLDVLERYL